MTGCVDMPVEQLHKRVAELEEKLKRYEDIDKTLFNGNKDLLVSLQDSSLQELCSRLLIVPNGISIATDASCNVVKHNAFVAEFLGVDPMCNLSFNGHNVFDFKILRDGELVRPVELPLQRAAWFGEYVDNAELDFVWDNGVHKTALISSRPLKNSSGEIIGAFATWSDITERKKSEMYYAKLFHSISYPKAIVSINELTYLDVNQSFLDFYGYSKTELIGRSTAEIGLLTPSAHQFAIKNLDELGYLRDFETVVTVKDGSRKTVLVNADIIEHYNQKSVVITLQDITSRRQAEVRFAKAFRSNPNPMMITSLNEGRIVDVNRSLLSMAGKRAEEVIGKTAVEFGIWQSAIERAGFVNQLLAGTIRNYEQDFISHSGQVHHLLISGVIIEIDSEKFILLGINDITEKRNFENEIKRLDRLNIVGQMAASIGHEIRNPMTTVRGYLQMLGKKQIFNQYKDQLELMIDELDRANSIITGFLSLAKNRARVETRVNLNSVIEPLYLLMEADAVKANKNIFMNLGEIPDTLMCSEEVRQVILNLVRNGLEVSPENSGVIVSTYVEETNIVLAVSDSGSGIPDEIADKLGTPFFTTKDNGVGLGLAVCYSIADRHGGSLKFKTGESGTTFCLQLPIRDS